MQFFVPRSVMLHVLVVLFMCFRVLFLFPTCRARVFRFYQSCIRPPPPPSPSPRPPAPQPWVAGIIGTARLQPQAPNFSRHCRTSTVSTRSQKHCRTPTANSKAQWALPDPNCELQISMGTARPNATCQWALSDLNGERQMSDTKPNRMPGRTWEYTPDGMPDTMWEPLQNHELQSSLEPARGQQFKPQLCLQK